MGMFLLPNFGCVLCRKQISSYDVMTIRCGSKMIRISCTFDKRGLARNRIGQKGQDALLHVMHMKDMEINLADQLPPPERPEATEPMEPALPPVLPTRSDGLDGSGEGEASGQLLKSITGMIDNCFRKNNICWKNQQLKLFATTVALTTLVFSGLVDHPLVARFLWYQENSSASG